MALHFRRFSIRNFGIHPTENAASNGINIIIKDLLNASKEIIYSISPEQNSIARICPLNDSTNDIPNRPLIIIARASTHTAMQRNCSWMRKTFAV